VALSRTTFRTGLQLSYEFTKRLTGHLGLNYSNDVYTSLLAPAFPGFGQLGYTDNTFELVLGAKYAVTNRVAMDLGFTHTEVDSGRPGSYSRNLYTAGLSLNY
jgi:long-subunit fatty acid transport protein